MKSPYSWPWVSCDSSSLSLLSKTAFRAIEVCIRRGSNDVVRTFGELLGVIVFGLVVVVEEGVVEVIGVEVVGFRVGVVVVFGVVDEFKVVGAGGGGLWYLVLSLWVSPTSPKTLPPSI